MIQGPLKQRLPLQVPPHPSLDLRLPICASLWRRTMIKAFRGRVTHFSTASLHNIKFIFYFKSSRISFETSFFFYLCSFGRKKVGGWAWPDMEIKSSPICSKSGPKSSHYSFHIKSDVFQKSPQVDKYLSNCWKKIGSRVLSKISHSGHTGWQ